MQRVQIGDDRQSSDDLWDETEALEVTSVYIAEKLLFFTLRELSARGCYTPTTRVLRR